MTEYGICELDAKEGILMSDGMFGNWDNSEVLFFILIFLFLFYNNRSFGFGFRDKC